MAKETATLGGGCFWCIEAIFQRLEGVDKVMSGYSGGHKDNPTYTEVCQSTTGHAEVVQISFDPEIISYEELLKIFFVFHDPTTLNRQGNDVGEQYRSVIFYHSEDQKKTAEKIISGYAKTLWSDPVVTELVKFEKFWPASADHQDYFNNNAGSGYCAVIINPKVQKLRQKYSARLKKMYK